MKRYYTDSSFLTAFLYADHSNHELAVKTLQKILRDPDCIFLISTLTFDETWMALHRCSEESRLKSFAEFSDHASEVLQVIQADPNFQIIETINPKELIEYAFIGAKKYNLRPRDSFHYAYVKMWSALLLTFDTDFNSTDVEKWDFTQNL